MNLIEIWNKLLEAGGVVMWPLGAVSFLIWLLLAYRLIDLSVHRFCADSDLVLLGRLLCAEGTIQAHDLYSKLCGIQLVIFQKLDTTSASKRKERLEMIIQECEQNIMSDKQFIRTLIHVAPLLGLLGTVWGMILTFNVIGILGTSEPRLLAHGISQAMLTTQAGLLIAVPSIFIEKRATQRESWILHKIEENRLILAQCFNPHFSQVFYSENGSD